ncbi:GAF domain-containing protein [Pseudanabaena sp. UWO311]|uniref:GAF domain-containing protein n=1 Tax=Pseudanabaena sp. UWO311 TaxID=2487337 RepID=UPI00115947D5|nr:GAF domain-containing protein [Pseudanabaena sp. UWO311]TYQ27738.1 GAF domain-containing protein [Pseudanabaena sp. UWO311]
MAIADTANLLEHIAKLEQENIALRTELAIFQERSELEKLVEAELVKANDALALTSARLAENPDLSSFLGYITQEAMAQLNANAAHLILFDEKRNVLRTAVVVEKDGIIQETPIAYEMLTAEVGFHTILEETQKPRFFDIETEAHLFWAGSIAYLRDRGLKQVLALPLLAGGKLFGHLAMAFINNEPIDKQKIELLQALGHQAALAIQLTNLAEEAKQAAIACEREQAAQERAVHLARANTALQKTVDALGNIESVEEFIPLVLKIVLENFQATSCSFFDSSGELIYLRYWLIDGQVLKPTEILALDPDKYELIIRLAEGFTVSDEYLGTSNRHRTRAVQLDHAAGTCVPEFDDFTRACGWESELNVPCFIGNSADGALVIYRGAGLPYSEAEIALAETLSAQLALALQTSRLAEEAKQVAIVREQKRVTQERAAVLELVNFTLQRSTERLSTATDPKAIIVEILRTIAEVMAPLGVNGIGLMSYQAPSKTVRVKVHIVDGVEQIIAGSNLDSDWSVNSPSMAIPWERIQSENFIWGLTSDTSVLIAEVRHYHESRGARAIAYVPLRKGEETTGWIGFDLASEIPPTPQQIEMIRTLVSQVSLAIEMEGLAETTRDTAIANVREKAAQERATQLEKINSALNKSLQQLASKRNVSHFLEDLLVVLSENISAAFAMLFTFDISTKTAEIVAAVERGIPYVNKESHDPYPQIGCEAENITLLLDTFSIDKEILFLNALEPISIIPEVIEWHARMGHQEIAAVPLVAGKDLIGMLGFAFTEKSHLPSLEIEFIKSLAAQATLALQLILLSEESKQAALALEREQAAEARVTQLARANATLKQTLDVLATEPELERSLGHVLKVTSEQLGSSSSALWFYDSIADSFAIHTVYLDGKIVPAIPENAPLLSGKWIRGRDLSADLVLKKHIRDRVPVIYQVDECPDIPTSIRRHMQRLGIKTLLGIPLLLGSEIIGSFTIRFDRKRLLEPDELELTQALAHQATLAIQLLKRAEEAKQAALYIERNRLAGEIHDTLAQSFTSISIQTGVIRWMLQQDPSAIESILDRINDIAQTGLAEARRSVWEIYPTAQEYANLAEKLAQLVEKLTRDCPTQVDLQILGSEYQVSAMIGYNLLKLAQEAITNALKHAKATKLSIVLAYQNVQVSLRIADNGCGFQPNLDNGGFGLLSISERSDRIGGQLLINSILGKGTEILVEIPLEEQKS